MENLEQFTRKKDFLICVDSDGCAMDTMDIKHFRCFGPCLVEEWNLKDWETPILARWNEMNLYTMTRGINRFKGLVKMLREVHETYTAVSYTHLDVYKRQGVADDHCSEDTDDRDEKEHHQVYGISPHIVVLIQNADLRHVCPVHPEIGGIRAVSYTHLLETVFGVPGVGKYIVDSIAQRNYPSVLGGALIIAIVLTLINLLVDISFVLIDPRLKTTIISGGKTKKKKMKKINAAA